jgi:hypothetical protein
MTFHKLVQLFEAETNLPIELPDIMSAIASLGIQDEIYCIPRDIDPGRLWGMVYQFKGGHVEKARYSKTVYGDPVFLAVIIYNQNAPPHWQRLICCKELIHLLDANIERPTTAEQVVQLAEKLVGPMATEDFGFADFAAAKDKLALYQALIILFPDKAREEALEAIASNKMPRGEAIKRIVRRTALPEQAVEMVLHEGWPALKKDLMDC